ncbi:MAG: KH domain-containing protein [Cyanobacteria bacterium P01_F01_bin.42]
MTSESFQPDYPELVRYLANPFLENPEALKLDCETYADKSKVWVRLAMDDDDKGRLLGPNGRHLQAIRRVVDIAATQSGHRVQVEVYGTVRESRPPSSSSRPRPRRPRR